MGKHYLFAASAAARWMRCGASAVIDVSRVRSASRPSADRGTMLHAAGEEALREGGDAPDRLMPPDRKSVQAYVDHVRKRPGKRFLEMKTELVEGLCGGTADCVTIDGTHLIVTDYKSGSGFVDPVENKQMIVYAGGVVKRLGDMFDIETVQLEIVQPALDNFNSWTLSVEDLMAEAAKIEQRVMEIVDGDAEFAPSEEGCRFCPAKSICPAMEQMALQAARDDFAGIADENAQAAEEGMDLSSRAKLIPFLKQWTKAVEAELTATLLNDPDSVAGFKVVEGRKGNRGWIEKAKRKAMDLLGSWGIAEKDIFTEPDMKSPAKIEALLKEQTGGKDELKERKRLLGECIEEGKEGAPTVVPEEDSRPALTRKDLAARDFAGVIAAGHEED